MLIILFLKNLDKYTLYAKISGLFFQIRNYFLYQNGLI